MTVFLFAWYWYAFIIQAAYECNLRAFLMSAGLEPTVETAQDILSQVMLPYLRAHFSSSSLYI